MHKDKLLRAIDELKQQRNAVIMAHYYQEDEVQEVADYVGDSLELAQLAATTEADVIVLCGVKFMGESAAILSPKKTVLLPAPDAGCPLADMATAEAVRAAKLQYPSAAVVCYVNSSAEVKAESDICCTSANAVAVVNSLSAQQVLFVPDKNLAHYVAQHTDKEVIAWEGYCYVHHNLTAEDVVKAREVHPEAEIAVHPECPAEVLKLADYVGSTSGIRRFVQSSTAASFVIGTEKGILRVLRLENPDKTLHLLSDKLTCHTMKLCTLEDVRDALLKLAPRVKISEEIRVRARRSLSRMLAVTANGTPEKNTEGGA